MSDDKPTKGPRAGYTRPVYLVFQIIDDNGNPIEFNKDKLNILAATRDTGIALNTMDNGKDKNVTYKMIPQIT
tara:strand:- start:2543 stop:2761 length:219 start_codon:yes stop_codon:yes gene_type:complete